MTTCIYCQGPGETSDHVPPQCFFGQPLPDDMITVPACETCNRGFSSDDEFVRNMLVSVAEAENHPVAKRSLLSKRTRSLRRSRRLYQRTLHTLRPVELVSEGGIILGRSYAMDFNQPQVDRFFRRLVRGLIFHLKGSVFQDCLVEWNGLSDRRVLRFVQSQLPPHPTFHGSVGADAFEFAAYMHEDPAASSLWLLRFYAGPCFRALFRPARLVAG